MTPQENKVLTTAAPPVIGGLIGIAVGVWVSTHQGQPYTGPLLAGVGALSIACDRIAGYVIRKFIKWDDAREAKTQRERDAERLTATIAQAEQDRQSTTDPVYQAEFDEAIHLLKRDRLSIMANQPIPFQVGINKLPEPSSKKTPRKKVMEGNADIRSQPSQITHEKEQV